jgi:hypothetical protein
LVHPYTSKDSQEYQEHLRMRGRGPWSERS